MNINKNNIKSKLIFWQIINPVISEEEGTIDGVAGNPLGSIIARLWQTMVVIGGLLVLLWFVWGAIDWIFSGGNEEKLKHARGRMTNAFIGLVLLVASFAIMTFLEFVFGFDLLNPVWPTAN